MQAAPEADSRDDKMATWTWMVSVYSVRPRSPTAEQVFRVGVYVSSSSSRKADKDLIHARISDGALTQERCGVVKVVPPFVCVSYSYTDNLYGTSYVFCSFCAFASKVVTALHAWVQPDHNDG